MDLKRLEKLQFILTPDIFLIYREYLNNLLSNTVFNLYSTIRNKYVVRVNMCNVDDKMRKFYDYMLVAEINSGKYDSQGYMLEELMKNIRENIPTITMGDFSDMQNVSPIYMCKCNTRIKNKPFNINRHNNGERHKKWVGIL